VLKDNPGNTQAHEYIVQIYYTTGKYAEAAKELQNAKNLSENQLGMLANIQLKQNDKAGYVQTLEKWLPLSEAQTGPTCCTACRPSQASRRRCRWTCCACACNWACCPSLTNTWK
jgi:hypothetical protein